MGALRQLEYISEQEYHDGEEISLVKHEWLDGAVYAMAGGTYNHSTLCSKVAAAADRALRGRPCKARNSEQRVKIESNGQETYPDAVIFCPPSRFVGKGDSTLCTPKVIFEVLSDSTQRYDRTGKFNLYKTIETFEEYVLIEQDRIWVDHFRRNSDGDWLHRSYISRSDTLSLESVGIQISLDDIYDELDVPEPLLHLEIGPDA
ncbi:Endonuclease, Uma2 family (restriction endonuclease fold) [Abditibacterium utsteinense]|uniref:Endonuclease, Uma2 family (Restriction endonuclease fold) n=1 Tax=Abditibacterium utsteinense TaxID=1960156 RepID=A0A2S8STL9_9BACT|nr:Uma2 family endonuclease [Abditibacterium utsteinense]PQV64153.1 Endonuclease, Uma2 family (restriction endonuclease fold) [Abditibacterium utsteinense]